MKVLMVNALYHPDELGGAERAVRQLAAAVRGIGWAVEVACLATDTRPVTETVEGVPVHRVPLHNVYPFLPIERRPTVLKPLWHAIDSANAAMAAALGRLLDRVRPDVVHTHNITGFSPLAWRAIARRGIPIVHTLHDHYLLCARATMYRDGQNCQSRHLLCAAYSIARLSHASVVNAVVGVSRYILGRHDQFGAFPRSAARHVIPNAVPFTADRRADEARGAACRFGFLGRLDPPKGLDVLLEACDGLPPAGWTLEIAGAGVPEYERTLKSRAVPANVRFVGRVDAAGFLRSTDVTVAPSLLHDSMPMAVVESCASGVPVIASRVGGIPEIIEEGRTGFLVPPEDARALRETMSRVIAAPHVLSTMREACIAAVARSAPDRVARDYIAVYESVLAGVRPVRPLA